MFVDVTKPSAFYQEQLTKELPQDILLLRFDAVNIGYNKEKNIQEKLISTLTFKLELL